MGRSRRRARTAIAAAPPRAADRQGAGSAPPRAADRKRAAAAPAPAMLRKTLGAYLAGAILLAILVLLGTVTLAGTLAPWLVLAVDAAASYALYRWAQRRLTGMALGDEDRLLQTL